MTSANDLGERKKVRARLAEDKVATATIFRPPSLPSPKLRSLFFEERKSLWTRVFGSSRLSSRRIGSDSWQVVDAQFDTVIARLYSCMQSEARIMLEPAAELLRILAVYRRKRRVLGDRKNI